MRISAITVNPTVGDINGNAGLITDAMSSLAGVDLALFPELSISGYPPKDLLWQEGFVEACEAAADRVGVSAPAGVALVLGLPMRAQDGHSITNSVLVYRDGARIARYDKRLLPTYNVFDEDRYFVAGHETVVFEHRGRRVGLSVCEDLWGGRDARVGDRYADRPDPIEELAQQGAEIVVSASACPFVAGKADVQREIIASHAAAHGLPIVSVNQFGATDDLIFDGHAVACDRQGRVVAETTRFTGEALDWSDQTPDASTPKLERDAQLFEALRLGVRDYVRKTGFQRVLIGLSGGIDSALTAAIAVAALGPEQVTGVSMPGPHSSEHSKSDAADLATRLGINMITAPIERGHAGSTVDIDSAFEQLGAEALNAKSPDLAAENLQSRLRGVLLMTLSNRLNALVLTTGNKSEMAVGYCTLYGDMNGALAVLSDVPKTWVYALSRWMNDHATACGFERSPIPENTIIKPPSAELAPDQLDSDSLPDYEVLDEIVRRVVEMRESPATIAQETRFDTNEVERVCAMIARNEYKRRQAAIGLKVTSVAFGPGRRVPVAHHWR